MIAVFVLFFVTVTYWGKEIVDNLSKTGGLGFVIPAASNGTLRKSNNITTSKHRTDAPRSAYSASQ
jgi:hypothetical protein